MGWEKLPYSTAENGFRSWSDTLFSFDGETYWKYLIPRASVDSPNDLRWVLALACMGLVLSIAFRVRVGIILAGCTVVMGAGFVLLGEDRLWNARLLPFYYLGLYLLAAVGVAEVGRTVAVLVARDPSGRASSAPRSPRPRGLGSSRSTLVSLPLRILPGGDTRADGSYTWMGLTNGVNQESFVRSWARWNYTGYEGKDAYGEYRALMTTMADVGAEHGCGRSFWEYEKEINRYGTPMALMLLPHWTDGCIGSMEGLFFEASATTPFHFLTQVELSADAQRRPARPALRRASTSTQGVRHLQLMGVRYYLATSVEATTAARAHPDLTELATSGPWVIFQVADSDLVTPARQRARRARRRGRRPRGLDLPDQGRRREVRRAGGALVPGPRRAGRAPRRRRGPTAGSASTSRIRSPRPGRSIPSRSPTSTSAPIASPSTSIRSGRPCS